MAEIVIIKKWPRWIKFQNGPKISMIVKLSNERVENLKVPKMVIMAKMDKISNKIAKHGPNFGICQNGKNESNSRTFETTKCTEGLRIQIIVKLPQSVQNFKTSQSGVMG